MNRVKAFLVIFIVFLLCNITLFVKGWSYVGYAVSLTIFIGYILFTQEHCRFNHMIWSTAFIMALTNIIAELNYKFHWFNFADPTRVDDWSVIGFVYLGISLIVALLWSRKKKQ